MKKSTIGQLEAAQLAISATIEICTTTKRISSIKNSLGSTLAVLAGTVEYLDTQPRVLSKSKKSIVSIQNTMQGLLEGLEQEDLSVKDFRLVCSNLTERFIPRMLKATSEEVKILPQPVTLDSDIVEPKAKPETPLPEHLQDIRNAVVAGGSMRDMLQTVRNRMVEINNRAAVAPASAPVPDEDADKDSELYLDNVDPRYKKLGEYYGKEHSKAETHLTALNKHKAMMPVSLKSHGESSHPFTMVKMPIVPLFDQWTMTQESLLKRLGIPFIPLSGYMIFEDQLLLLVSKTAGMEATDPKRNKKVVTRKPKPKVIVDGKVQLEQIESKRMLDFTREQQRVADYAKVILDIVNEHSSAGNSYTMVSDKYVANPRNQDLVCFWVMSTAKLSALIRASGAFGSSKVRSWGFPWVDLKVDQVNHHKEFLHPSNNKDHPRFLEYDKNRGLRPAGWKSSDVVLPRSVL